MLLRFLSLIFAIRAVEKMGYNQGFAMTGLKFTIQQGQIYLDNDWIAGVDYDEYEEEDNSENKNDDWRTSTRTS